ncbi:Repressed by EFG1 protein 1 [Elsinoe australis]|uniref:Repressed by EFG1 protein 1 n=1 Tax=Elsinoe australis TaxID=40998 RepID=A0A2P7Z5Y3_9PEZI|nr:Repressed by EFG1 protein 1 [Elsinoe australis]
MRSSVLFTAAFAAVALASPVLDARGEVVVTDNEVVYVTDIVTVTEGQAAPTSAPAATSTQKSYGGRRHRKHRSKTSAAPAPSAPAYSAPAPSAPAPAPSSEAPAPAPTSYEQPAPQPSSEAPAPAPTSYDQPAPAPSSSAAPAPAPSSSQAPPPAYTPVSNEPQAPLKLHQAQALLPKAPAQAPPAPALHSLPISAPHIDFIVPDCHGGEATHLLKRDAAQLKAAKKVVATKAKVAVKTTSVAAKKKVAATTTKKSPTTKAQATKAASKAASKAVTTKSSAPKSSSTPSKASSSSSKAGTKTSTKPATGVATTYKDAVIAHHNYHRANHSAADITWSDALAATAKKIADTCVYKHNTQMDGGGYGQNIAAGQAAGQIGSIISDQFYNGEVGAFEGLYGQASPDMGNFENWGHMSQIVWKSTTEVGCYTTDCSTNLQLVGSGVPGYFTVCNYKEAGNMAGAYGENIGSCLGKPTIKGSYNVDPAQIAKNMPAV